MDNDGLGSYSHFHTFRWACSSLAVARRGGSNASGGVIGRRAAAPSGSLVFPGKMALPETEQKESEKGGRSDPSHLMLRVKLTVIGVSRAITRMTSV